MLGLLRVSYVLFRPRTVFFAMDSTMGDIKYVQLEAADFLSDPDFQLMSAAERGIYTSIIFYMYGNEGKILDDPEQIKRLTNANEDFEKQWENVRKRFISISEAGLRGSRRYSDKKIYLTHKRVRKELIKAKKFIQHQRTAGLASAAARQQACNDGLTAVQPRFLPNKVKESKLKESKERKRKRKNTPPTLSELQAYIKEKSYNVDAVKFLEWYTEAGWKDRDGKPVENWKLKVISWSNRNDTRSPNNRTQSQAVGRNTAVRDENYIR